jgi:acylphosphatase
VIRRRVIVQGRVQGVGFRYSVRRAAQSRDVAGWVRNRPDGAVEAAFEGEPAAVDALVRLAREGPRGAAVAGVQVLEEPPEGLVDFEVRG